MLPSPSTSGQQVPLRTAPPFRNPLWISRLLSALLFLQRAEGQLLSLEKLGQTALACLKQHSVKQTQEPTRVSSLLETALKHTIQRGHGILSTHPTPRSHILEHSVWDTSENECDQIPLVISSWDQVESFAFSLSLGCDCTKSQSPVLPWRCHALSSTKCTWFLSTPHSPQAPLLLFIPIYVLFRGCYTHFFHSSTWWECGVAADGRWSRGCEGRTVLVTPSISLKGYIVCASKWRNHCARAGSSGSPEVSVCWGHTPLPSPPWCLLR